jgi:hypothetical protein
VNAGKDKKDKKSFGAGHLLADASVTAETTVVGIDGSNGKDVIDNYNPVTVNAYTDTFGADITVIGIDAGNGKDKVTNWDVVDVDAVATASDTKAIAIGIDAGNGKDTVTNEGTVDASATSTINIVDETWDFIDEANTDIEITSDAETVGISGGSGNGKDELTNAGELSASATAETSVKTTTGTFAGTAGTTVSLSAIASSVGIDGGNGKDAINVVVNTGLLQVSATATTLSEAVTMTFAGASDSDAPMTATAAAEGISGGNGKDTINNQGEIVVGAVATTESLGVSLTYAGAAKTNEDAGSAALATATATGLSGGNGMDEIANFGSVKVTSSANTNAEDVAVAVQGTASADSSLTAKAEAKGIDGGHAKDVLTNAGTLDVSASASSYGLSVDINFVDVTQTDLTRNAESTVVGIDGGQADDEVSNTGTLTATALSTVEAWTVDVNAVDTAIVDSSITAKSGATGMTGGAGREELFNAGTLTAEATSSVKAWTFELTTLDCALGNASTTADATAIGIDASVEDEVVTNTGSVTAIASSEVETGGITLALVDLTILQDIGKLVGVDEEYLKPGNASTILTSSATGIRMDPDDDEVKRRLDDVILNQGDVTAIAKTEALSIGVGIGAEGIPAGLLDALQVWEDSNLADASTSLTSTATELTPVVVTTRSITTVLYWHRPNRLLRASMQA